MLIASRRITAAKYPDPGEEDNTVHKILIFGAAGRVGQSITAELMRRGQHVVMADRLPREQLEQIGRRHLMDSQLTSNQDTATLSVHGGIDALQQAQVSEVLAAEKPDLVINYAIPITWDATKRLPNYNRISAAGLGAFTPIQVFTPWVIGRAIAELELDCKYMVGNLPDITIPILSGLPGVHRPSCGAGNVGLIATAIKHQVCQSLAETADNIEVDLVAHHIHWVAPREPGYPNDAPFLLRVARSGTDITDELGDPRSLMNSAIVDCYEAGAGFSSTTGYLATQIAMALLDTSEQAHSLHAPAPNGLPGGYPVQISQGTLQTRLPNCWTQKDALKAMVEAQGKDGVALIDEQGTTRFSQQARDILKAEIGFELPAVMAASDIEAVARDQIATVQGLFDR